MKRMITVTAAALALSAALSSPLALAGSANICATIERVLVMANDSFGGCMALLSVDPQSVLPVCAKNWVTFSCTGTFTDPVRAYHMLDLAELALVFDKKVGLQVIDSSTHNGYCMVNSISMSK